MSLPCLVANSHMPRCAPAVLRQCRVLSECPRVAGKIQTTSHETPRGSRKKPNLGRSPIGRRETADVSSHIPYRVPAVLWRDLEKSLAKRRSRSTAWARHRICALAFKVGHTLCLALKAWDTNVYKPLQTEGRSVTTDNHLVHGSTTRDHVCNLRVSYKNYTMI